MSEPNIFCIQGVEPEVLAYSMAKYSRSSLPMKESLAAISSQKASDFLNTFYFQYGHRSIADLAHLPMAIENISMLAAIEVVDESLWSGQERSTRYQDFKKRDFFVPPELTHYEQVIYTAAIQKLFDAYEDMTAFCIELLKEENPRPPEMDEATYVRTIKARAFDVARYYLPLATKTSVGQITSARTLEGQVSRMFSSPLPEIQQIAGMMKNAARDENAAPTLLKYTEPSSYIIESAKKLKALMVYLMGGIPVTLSDVVEMITFQSVEEELVATLLYEHGSHPMHDILNQMRLVASKDKAQYQLLTKTVIDTAVADRSKFDELLRAWRVGAGFVFDIAMDIGGFRDLHRHRRCIQVAQGYFAGMGADELQCPVKMLSKGGCDEVSVAKWNVLKERFSEDLEYLQGEFDTLQNLLENRHAPKQMAAYMLPLGIKKRFLMKMDLAELAYITELRTGPAGHASYRRVTWKMYELLRERHPEISAHIRATDFAEPVDLLKR